MNTNAKFSGLVSELNELVETGLVEIKVTRSTSTGYGAGSLEGALQRQVEVQTVHTLAVASEDHESEYVKCTETYGKSNGYHVVGDVYRVTDKEDEGNGKFYIKIENFEGQSGQVANIDLENKVDENNVNYAHATADEFYAQKETVDTDAPAESIKRIIFTIMGLDTEQTIQRKIEICKQRIYEIENPDPIQALRNSDTLIDCMDGWYGTGK